MTGKHEGKPDELAQAQARRASVALEVPKASWKDFFRFYGKWKNGKILLGTAGSWFFLDVAFYGLGLNSSTVLTAIGYGTGPTVYKILYNLAAGNCILVCAGAIPGYWLSVATIDTVGRKPVQLMGFVILTILFIVWGFSYNHLSGHAHLALYVLVQFFFNFGTGYPTATSRISCSYTKLIEPQARMRQLSLSQENASQQDTAQHPTVFPPRLARLAQSLLKLLSPLCEQEVQLLKSQTHGKTTSCKFTPFSCSSASSAPF